MLRFGPGGASPLFYEQGGKSGKQVPGWLAGLGLNAYEYQCTRGVNIGKEAAQAIGEEAGRHGIVMSIHGPYYINLAADPPVRDNTKRHILKSMQAAVWMGASKVVFHPGAAKPDPREAMRKAKILLEEVETEAEDMGLFGVKLAAETVGKQNQLGSLDDIIELSQAAPLVMPAIDFGHLWARGGGKLVDTEDFCRVLDRLEQGLGAEVLQNLHLHFSPIEFTKGGEKRHRNLTEEGFGPQFEPLAKALLEKNASGTVICESWERQALDALAYQDIWQRISSRR